jgi:thiamine pyrophosphokinase
MNGEPVFRAERKMTNLRPASPDPDHAGGGKLNEKNILPGGECFFMPRAIIFINGNLPEPALIPGMLKPEDVIIAADGGTHHVLNLGLLPSIVIGDLDSLTDKEKTRLRNQNIRMLPYPADKDETDLELALDYAVEAGYQEILLVGALGRRLDQTLGNISLLTNPALLKINVRMDDGMEEVLYIKKSCQLHGREGDVISLVPWAGNVTGIMTEGLRWKLKNETLYSHETRGISNQFVAENASISIKSGLLLVIHQHRNNSTK